MEDVNQAPSFQVLNIGINDLEFRVKIVEMQKLKAIVSIDFGDFIIKGFRVNFSDYKNKQGDELWVIPPSYRDSGGRYRPIFFCPNKDLWQEIEKKIAEEYKKASEEYYKKRMEVDF